MRNESRPGAFHIVTPPNSDTVRDMKARIARQAGIPTCAVDDREVATLRTMFDGGVILDPYSWGVHSKYIKGRRVSETEQQIIQALEGMSATDIYASSYGIDMPSYLRGLRDQKNRIGDHPHVALLIGALTTDTIREYVTTVKNVYNNSYCEVIDVEGEKTAEISPDLARFRYGNGLSLPFGNGTVDSVHTNNLFHMLKDEAGQDAPEKRTGIFQEAARVLRPEGVLLMAESINIPLEQLGRELGEAGFSYAEIFNPIHFKNRHLMELFLRSTAADPLDGTTAQESGGLFIIARK